MSHLTDATEIRATIRRLKQQGEYEDYLSEDAGAAADALGLLIVATFELADEEVDALITHVTDVSDELSADQTRQVV